MIKPHRAHRLFDISMLISRTMRVNSLADHIVSAIPRAI